MLGPLLFLIYINDLINCSDLGKFILFADETNIFVSGHSYEIAVQKANGILTSENKLHINMKKSCFMHFKPKGPSFKKNLDQPEVPPIKINDFEIKEADNTKFLGVTIDNELSWIPHLTILAKKLRCCTGQLNRIKKYLPASLHKNLYHTLCESHLSYGITVWGNISISKLKSVFTAQKHCILIMFGDNEAYLEKHRTAARTRHIDNQKLGPEFFEKEHTKPLFKNNDILTVNNLYNYHLLLGIGMILKSHTPIALYAIFKVTRRKPTLIIVPTQAKSVVFKASILWNTYQTLPEERDFTVGISFLKKRIKILLLKRQKIGDEVEWHPQSNFNITDS